MIRVVIYTNVVVSALLQPEGLPAAVLMLTLSREIQLCVSDAVFAEYDDVIRRARLKRTGDVIEGTLKSIREFGRWVTRMRSGCGGRLSGYWQPASFPRSLEENASGR